MMGNDTFADYQRVLASDSEFNILASGHSQYLEDGIDAALRYIIKAERDACAKIAKNVGESHGRGDGAHVASEIEDAIRARGT